MRDDFSETFQIRKGEERLNAGPWRSVGTLAAVVFRFPHEPPAAKKHMQHPMVRKIWRWVHASPHRDASELLTNAGKILQIVRMNGGFGRVKTYLDEEGEWLPPDPWCSRLVSQLPTARRITEKIVRAAAYPRHRLPADDDSAALGGIVEWMGCTKNVDQFRTTPAGAVLISAIFGRTRGGLRLCGSCGGFAVFPRPGFPRRYCDKCKALSPGLQAGRGTGLPLKEAILWRKVLSRMRRRGFKRLRMDDAAKRQWKKRALQALHEVKTDEELMAWEANCAPKSKPGRPARKKKERAL
jgi:hypothetical protein